MDELELFAQPHCPTCGTVLQDFEAGYRCGTCDLLFLRTTEFFGGDPVT